MPQNFLCPQRDQPMLLPADMREWLPEDDLAFVVLDAVAAWTWASSAAAAAAGAGLTGTAGRRLTRR